ncbi:MAG: LysR family transcriptional regulator [Betaproteobacteria bacterium]|nr:LysR family transcriptional regulator [Betaproteobacteria bacterium]
MDFNLIRSFVTLAREGNLTRTAQRLHLTQPALSLQLKKLHEQLGLVLFERTPRGMRLTRAGEQLLPAAQRALEASSELVSLAAGISGQIGGRLRIGTIVDPEFLRLGPFLKRLVEYHPGLSTDLAHGMSGALRREVAANRLDVAYTLGQPGMGDVDDAFTVLTLTGFDYRVIAPPGWQERVRGKDWKDLAQLPWIGTPPDSVHHRLLEGIFRKAGVSQRIVAQVDLEPSMLDLVKSGVGLSLARDSIALRAAHAGGIVIADRVQVSAELGFLCLCERRKEPAIAAAFSVIDAVWAMA